MFISGAKHVLCRGDLDHFLLANHTLAKHGVSEDWICVVLFLREIFEA